MSGVWRSPLRPDASKNAVDLVMRRNRLHGTIVKLQRYSSATSTPVIHIPKTNVYHFGDGNHSTPVFKDLEWTVRNGENWAIVGPAGSGKSLVLEMLLGYMRLSPSPRSGIYPLFFERDTTKSPFDNVALVSFIAQRRASGGEFYDFTSRYGAVRDEERLTLREALFSDVNGDGNEKLDYLTDQLDLGKLLDLPFIVLSNGQTRRARIAKALMGDPNLLLLDEPLTGLDVEHRPKLTDLLYELHQTASPRVLMALRTQDPLPDWITHVASVEGQHIRTLERSKMSAQPQPQAQDSKRSAELMKENNKSKEVVSMQDVNVKYGDRHVLKHIHWTVKEGERWHLQGSNGSGKTTLISILTGDHPQSYTQKHLELFSKPRKRQPTSSLQQMIGCASPEIFAAFPRRLGANALTVRDAIATGFENTYSYRPCTLEMEKRTDHLLARLGPSRLGASEAEAEHFASRAFAELGPGEQSLVLLMRALVSEAPLLVLDEVFAGMDDRMIRVAREFLRDEIDPKQAVVFITHWEEELPWEAKKIRLEDGRAVFP